MLKLVVARAHALHEEVTSISPEGDPLVYPLNGYMTSARVRLALWF
jgi:hypothetical protein